MFPVCSDLLQQPYETNTALAPTPLIEHLKYDSDQQTLNKLFILHGILVVCPLISFRPSFRLYANVMVLDNDRFLSFKIIETLQALSMILFCIP